MKTRKANSNSETNPVHVQTITEATGSVDSLCPWCGHVLLRTFEKGYPEVPGRKTWLSDGDTILGILESLTEEQKECNAFDCHLSVGDCPSCRGDYYTIEAVFIDAEETDELDDFLNFNVPMEESLNFVCTLAASREELPKRWIMGERKTPGGPMHDHMFGPFRLDSPEEIIHPEWGVMACTGGGADPWEHGKTLILSLFDDLRKINRETHEKWEDERVTEMIEELGTENPGQHRENEPLFLAGPMGGASVNPRWSDAVSQFCETVKKILGPNPSGRFWPYRLAGSMLLAVDLKGDKGEVNLTIYECGSDPLIPVFSGKEDSGWECEPTVTDAVDAFYLVFSLMKHLRISGTTISAI